MLYIILDVIIISVMLYVEQKFNVQHDRDKDHVEYDVFWLNGEQDMTKNLGYVMRPEVQSHVFFSVLLLTLW